MNGRGIKSAVYAAMPAAYAEASDGGRLPAPARQIAYALRRLTGLGDALSMDYLLKGNRNGLINAYHEDHPDDTADWDVVRDARGSLIEPHTGRTVPLGTIAVRDYLRYDGVELNGDKPPQFSLDIPTHGPRDRFGAILYIEKEGFAEQLAADRVQERWDIAICSSKGYSVRAARHALVTMATRNDVPVLVAHDFDKQGVGIFDLIDVEVDAVDLGLRLDDIEDPRWGLAGQAEAVTYREDPRPNLAARGASPDEIDFLCRDGRQGERELNALVGRTFIDWLESKLGEHGIEKVVPDDLETAFRYVYRKALINRAIDRASADATRVSTDVAVPDDLADVVAAILDGHPDLAWDDALVEVVTDTLNGEAA